MFVTSKPFQPSLMFVGKAKSIARLRTGPNVIKNFKVARLRTGPNVMKNLRP